MSTAKYSLNIYGKNDEITKTFETNVIRWKLFKKAVQMQEDIKDKSESEQINAVSEFMLAIFPSMTEKDIENADVFDIFAVFKQIINKANAINGGKTKN